MLYKAVYQKKTKILRIFQKEEELGGRKKGHVNKRKMTVMEPRE